jgi:VWFA-related protein
MSRQIICLALISTMLVTAAVGQQAPQSPDDVLRISTELVQTGVVVLDKQGRFVDGLKANDFLFKVDGQPVTPTFFEQIIAGSARERKLEGSIVKGTAPASPSDVTTRGRTIIFFIDDLHLSARSVQSTRKGILEFVEKDMTLEDQVAVVSPSGQIGFLQRFSDLKPVVRAAVDRINHKPYSVRDHEQVPMTEYQAMRIDQGDSGAADYFVTELLKANNIKVPGGVGPPAGGPAGQPQRGGRGTTGITSDGAKRLVKDRASLLMRQSESVTSGTLTSLESLMRSLSQTPGRKVVFLISDGFFLNERSTGFQQKLGGIADAALRAGMTIYSVDARGLVSIVDAGSNRADPNGILSRVNIGEVAAAQDGLNSLAVDTGGKAFFHGSITDAVNQGLKETSNYYLLAWRPNTQEQKSANFKRLEVSIPGRPELTVRVPRGFFGTEPKPEKTIETAAAPDKGAADAGVKGVESALISALAAPSARLGVPTNLSVSFLDVPNSGLMMTAATQVSTDVLDYGDGTKPAAVDLVGVVLSDEGKQAGVFKTRINVKPLPATAAVKNPTVVYSHKLPLKPGIYQVRVATRDEKSGRVGSAAQWIEIPDLTSKKLTLSSLLLSGDADFSVDRRFPQGGQMSFLTVVYNASAKLESQIEILRGGQRVIASPVRPLVVEPGTDLARIPYGAGIALRTMAPGRYVLRVTVYDRTSNTSATNEVLFDIE